MNEQVTLKEFTERLINLEKLYSDATIVGASLNCYEGNVAIGIHIEEDGQPFTLRLPCHIK